MLAAMHSHHNVTLIYIWAMQALVLYPLGEFCNAFNFLFRRLGRLQRERCNSGLLKKGRHWSHFANIHPRILNLILHKLFHCSATLKISYNGKNGVHEYFHGFIALEVVWQRRPSTKARDAVYGWPQESESNSLPRTQGALLPQTSYKMFTRPSASTTWNRNSFFELPNFFIFWPIS